MSAIIEIVIKYLKLNPKRTGIAVGSMIICVFFLTCVSNIFVWGFTYMRELEEETAGTWQARYNNVTEEQAEKLQERAEFSKCTISYKKDDIYEADIELPEINEDIFEITQKIGEEIGMPALEEQGIFDYLPNGKELMYDISYHMKLLDFYGISYENVTSMKQILLMVLGIFVGISALLLYSVFSLSFLEKKKYLGLLSCAGASIWQRRMFMLGEGLMIGVFGIPIGVALGSVGMLPLTNRLQEWLNGEYGLQMNLPIVPDINVTLGAALLGILTIVIAVAVPTIQAGRVNPLELIFHAGETEPGEIGGKYHPSFSLEFNMALRNLRSNQKRFAKMLLLGIASIAVAFNGYLAIQEMKGTYLLEDTREEVPLDAWIRIYSDDFTIEEKMHEQLKKALWCKDVSYFSVLDLGAFIVEKDYVREDLQDFIIPWHDVGNPAKFEDEKTEVHYGFPMKVIGVEDSVYRNVISQYEFDDKTDWGQLVEQGVYPVVLDDYIPIKKGKDNYTSYQKVLSDLKGEYISIQFGMYGDYVLFGGGTKHNLIYRTKDANTSFYVNGTLSERFPIPIVPGAYGLVADDYTQMESYYIRCYMPYSIFQRFLQDEQIKKTYGVLDAGAMEHPIEPKEYNPVMNYMFMNRILETDEQSIEKDIARIMNELELRPYSFSLPEGEYANASNTWEYVNIENWNRTQIMKNANEILKRIFFIGAILLVLFFTIFSLISYVAISIYLRRRELSILKSMGMGYKNLRKMLLYENAVLIGLSAIYGTAVSWFIAHGQLKQIREGAATVKIKFPFDIYTGILCAVLLLSGSIVVLMVRKIRNVNIIDALKSENE